MAGAQPTPAPGAAGSADQPSLQRVMGPWLLLLLAVFTVVNIAVLVLRKDTVGHKHFRAPAMLPVIGTLSCAFLVGPWTGRDPVQYNIAAVLLGIGVVLCAATALVHQRMRSKASVAAPTR